MAGEVVLGGQQDRCIGQDTIIPPGVKRKPVSVFCVEHGRWQGEADFATVAGSVASVDVRKSAQKGAFIAKASPMPAQEVAGHLYAMSGRARDARPDRLAGAEAIGKAQQEVWSTVAAKTDSFAASTPTGTYRTVLNMSGGNTAKSVAPYVQALNSSLDRDPKLVGIFAAVNGKIVAADIFGESALFRKLWPKLLKSYASDAAEKAGQAPRVINSINGKDAAQFFADASGKTTKTAAHLRAGESVNIEGQHASMYKLEYTRAAGGFGGGKDGRAVHENLIRK